MMSPASHHQRLSGNKIVVLIRVGITILQALTGAKPTQKGIN